MSQSTLDKAFAQLTSEDDGRACLDIPERVCNHLPRNFFTHIAALGSTKTADGLIDPKLVLSWLMTAVGAPAALVGLLVPIREAGALLPQLFTAGVLRLLPERKWAWAAGSAVQGAAAAGIAASALTLNGATAGWAILACLTVLALARSVCSVSYKDVLGKTVSKSKRGTATGTASSLAAGGVIVFALLLISGVTARMELVIAAILIAAGLWLFAAALFMTLAEEPGATEGGAKGIRIARENIRVLAEDKQLRRFIATRGLLIATALAPPFLVSLGAGVGAKGLQTLGLLVLASAGASLVSSYVWGRLADRSSRKVLALSALAGAVSIGLTAGLGALGSLSPVWVLPVLLFGLMLAYQGVRLGRSTHLIDMSPEDQRATYTALSNTIIGVLLLLGGLFSLLAEWAGAGAALFVMAGMCALAVPAALSLDEVQAE